MKKPYAESTLKRKYRETHIYGGVIFFVQGYLDACANFYAILEIEEAWKIIDKNLNNSISDLNVTHEEFDMLLPIIARDSERQGYIMPKNELFIDGDDSLLLISKNYLLEDTEDVGLEKLHKYYDFDDISELPPVIDNWDKFYDLYRARHGKTVYVPATILAYSDPEYFEETPQVSAMIEFLEKRVPEPRKPVSRNHVAKIVMEDMLAQICNASIPFTESISSIMRLLEDYNLKPMDEKDLNRFLQLFTELSNNTRIPANKGHTPNELRKPGLPTSISFGPGIQNAIRSGDLDADKLRQTIFAQSDWPSNIRSSMLSEIDKLQPGEEKWVGGTRKKVGPNDPCPCGSGKKYKKCCGR